MSSRSRDDAAFSFPVKVGHVAANPVEVTLSTDERERQALAGLWKVLSVEELSATLHLNRWKRDGIRMRGHFRLVLTQACVVTLAPVQATIEEDFEQVYLPEGSKLARRPANDMGELVLDPEGPDLPEVFSGDSIDAGLAVAEFAALAIDPYPRAPGAEFAGHVESKAEDDRKPSPFAVLKDWKKD